MNDKIIKTLIESTLLEKEGLLTETREQHACEEIVFNYLKDHLEKDSLNEFEPLLSNFEYEILNNALVIGFKLGMNLMKDCQI